MIEHATSGELRFVADARLRTIPRAAIVEELAFQCWPMEVHAGRALLAIHRAGEALERLRANGLPSSGSGDDERFDNFECMNLLKSVGLREHEPAFEAFVESKRALVASAPSDGRSLELEVSFLREIAVAREVESLRVRLPFPLADPWTGDAQLLSITPAVERRVEPARVSLTVTVPRGAATVTISAKLRFTARAWSSALAEPVVAEARAVHLRPSEGLIQVTPFVHELAQRIVKDTSSRGAIAEQIFDYINRELRAGYLRHDALGTADPLKSLVAGGWFDCYAGGALFAALCRARNVAARMRSGYLLWPAQPTLHHWVEFADDDDRWRPADLMGWDLGAGRDAIWKKHFFGRLDYRMATQSPPLIFTGHIGCTFPSRWHMIQRGIEGGGAELRFLDADTGRLVHRDVVEIAPMASDDGRNER